MDIKLLSTRSLHNEGAEMRVKDQYGNDTDFFVRFVGVDSLKWNEVRTLIARESAKGSPYSDAKALALAVLSWRGLESDGAPVEFNEQVAEQLFDEAPYVQSQGYLFMMDRENFSERSLTK